LPDQFETVRLGERKRGNRFAPDPKLVHNEAS